MIKLCSTAVACLMFASIVLVTAQPKTHQAAADQFEVRCGWFSNPTPGNAWLGDKDGQWTIGEQGGHQAEGEWPAFKADEWVRTNGEYGYGCACLRVKVNRETHEVMEIKAANSRPLSACRKDKALKEPK